MRKIFYLIVFIFAIFQVFSINAYAREHPYFMRSVSISPDGKYILAGRLDNKIILWDRENKKTVKVIEGRDKELNIDANFTPDSKYIVFQDGTFDLMFYDIEKGKIIKRIPLDYESNHIVFLDNMKKMVLGGTDGRIEAWDLQKDEKIKTLKVPDIHDSFPAINGMALSPDGNYFVTSVFADSYWDNIPEPENDFERVKGKNGYVWTVKHRGTNLWDANKLEKTKKLTGKGLNGRTWPLFSADKKYILLSSEGGGIYAYDAKTGAYLREYNPIPEEPNLGYPKDGLCFLGNNYFATLYEYETKLMVYKSDQNGLVKEISLKYKPVTGAITSLPEKNLVVTGDKDGSISVYRFNPEKLDIELEWHPKPVPSGIIKWISPLYLINKTPEQVSELRRRYEEEQKKLIEQEKQ